MLDTELLSRRQKNKLPYFYAIRTIQLDYFLLPIKENSESVDNSTKVLIDECFIEFVDDDDGHHNQRHSMINKIR